MYQSYRESARTWTPRPIRTSSAKWYSTGVDCCLEMAGDGHLLARMCFDIYSRRGRRVASTRDRVTPVWLCCYWPSNSLCSLCSLTRGTIPSSGLESCLLSVLKSSVRPIRSPRGLSETLRQEPRWGQSRFPKFSVHYSSTERPITHCAIKLHIRHGHTPTEPRFDHRMQLPLHSRLCSSHWPALLHKT